MKYDPPALAPVPVVNSILRIPVTYDGEPMTILPISIWFGSNDFKDPQRWRMKAKEVVTGKDLDLDLSKLDFTPAPVPTVSKSQMKRLNTTQQDDTDPRQLTIDV